MILKHYTPEDVYLASLLPELSLINDVDCGALPGVPNARLEEVYRPEEGQLFTHECAVIRYHGVLFAAWYNNPDTELHGVTPIRGRYSRDDGKSWSDIETYAVDESGEILYCPPVFGICEDRLYMLVNEMYKKPDHIHALDLYRLDERTMRFEKLWSRPIPFKLNTNVVRLNNGKLLLPGRIAELDAFPNTPAVLISDSGKIDAEWRLVYVAPNGDLPDGSQLVHPEQAAILDKDTVYLFCRDDQRNVPLMYRSDDNGEHWVGPIAHDIPFSSSKIYAGNLSDGRNYLIGNLHPGRRRLALFLTQKGSLQVERGMLLQDGCCEELGYAGSQWSYPVACEEAGKLYVIYSACPDEKNQSIRGAVLSVIDL